MGHDSDSVIYGKELILDVHECFAERFTRRSIRRYCKTLCKTLEMKRGPLYWWDDYWTLPWLRETEPHLKGTSAVQFIQTSTICIHALELQRALRLNVFSCKHFEVERVVAITLQWFGGRVVNEHVLDRM